MNRNSRDCLAGFGEAVPACSFDGRFPVCGADQTISTFPLSPSTITVSPSLIFSVAQYAEINADGSVTARDMWKTDSTTTFWRIQ